MRRVKKFCARKLLLSIESCACGGKTQKEISSIRGDVVHIFEKMNPFESKELIERFMKRKKAGLFINVSEDMHLFIGRASNDEIIDMVEFKIGRYKSMESFSCFKPELWAKSFVLLQNVCNARLENLIMDFFCTKSSRVCLEGVRHAWIFSRSEKYVLKYVRILSDLSVENCGPLFEMDLLRSYHCGDELYKKATGVLTKPRNNIVKNEFKDRVGKVYVGRHDLGEVRFRKIKKCKNTELIE